MTSNGPDSPAGAPDSGPRASPSTDARLRELEALMRQLHGARDTRQVLADFLNGLRRIHGPFSYVELVVDTPPDTLPAQPAEPDGYRVTRFLRFDGREVVPNASPFRVSWRQPSYRSGLLATFLRASPEVQRRLITPAADDPFAESLAGHKLAVAIPVLSPGHPEWVVLLGQNERFMADLPDSELLIKANLLFVALQAISVAGELRTAQRQLEQQVQRIAEIQRSLLPASSHLRFDNLEVAWLVEPSHLAGGDLVDLADLDGRLLGMLVADASGHGPSAAVVAAMVAAIVRAYPRPLGNPTSPDVQRLRDIAELLEFANDHLCEKQIEQNFVTAWIAAYDSSTHVLQYASAGHPLPLLCRHGHVEPLPGLAGLPLGIFPGQNHCSASVELRPGDLLLAYTDGISEAASPDGELFGVERLATLLHRGGSPAELIEAVRLAVREFTATDSRSDDQTLLGIRVH